MKNDAPLNDAEAVALLDFCSEPVLLLSEADSRLRIVFANHASARLLQQESAALSGRDWIDFCADRESLMKFREAVNGVPFYASIRSGQQEVAEMEWLAEHRPNSRCLLRRIPPVQIPNGEAVDKTDDGRSIFQRYIESSPDGVLVADANGFYVFANGSACRMTGYQRDELVGAHLQILAAPERKEVADNAFQALQKNGQYSGEGRFLRKDGSFGIWFISAVQVDEQHNVAFFKDVTARHAAEEQLKKNLREKEALLQELHHRVKNNLNVVVSLLSLQRKQLENPTAGSILLESESRIRAMALVHETAYNNSDLSRIDFAAYASRLLRYIERNYKTPGCMIHQQLNFHCETVPLDRAVPLGLILHELAVNSYQHAFKDRKQGVVTVALEKKDAGCILTAADNGKGFEHGTPSGPGLGFELVRILVQQIGGELRFSAEQGTTVTVTFENY